MENLDYVTLPSVSGEYYPGDAIDVYVLADALKLSGKHIWIQPYEGRITYSSSSTWPRRPSAATTSSASARSST